MALKITTNISSQAASRLLADAVMADSVKRLTTGMRVSKAQDDPAAFTTAAQERAQPTSLLVATANRLNQPESTGNLSDLLDSVQGANSSESRLTIARASEPFDAQFRLALLTEDTKGSGQFAQLNVLATTDSTARIQVPARTLALVEDLTVGGYDDLAAGTYLSTPATVGDGGEDVGYAGFYFDRAGFLEFDGNVIAADGCRLDLDDLDPADYEDSSTLRAFGYLRDSTDGAGFAWAGFSKIGSEGVPDYAIGSVDATAFTLRAKPARPDSGLQDRFRAFGVDGDGIAVQLLPSFAVGALDRLTGVTDFRDGWDADAGTAAGYDHFRVTATDALAIRKDGLGLAELALVDVTDYAETLGPAVPAAPIAGGGGGLKALFVGAAAAAIVVAGGVAAGAWVTQNNEPSTQAAVAPPPKDAATADGGTQIEPTPPVPAEVAEPKAKKSPTPDQDDDETSASDSDEAVSTGSGGYYQAPSSQTPTSNPSKDKNKDSDKDKKDKKPKKPQQTTPPAVTPTPTESTPAPVASPPAEMPGGEELPPGDPLPEDDPLLDPGEETE